METCDAMNAEGLQEIVKATGEVAGLFRDFFASGNERRLANARAEGIKAIATAEVEAAEIKARGMLRVAKEIVWEQGNLESIRDKAATQLADVFKESSEIKVDDDWFHRWSEYARAISDDEVQNLWAKILAGEANAPGRFSLQTMHTLSMLRRQEALDFEKLNAFFIRNEDGAVFFVPFPKNDFFEKRGMDLDFFARLTDAGLIQSNQIELQRLKRSKLFVGDSEFLLTNPPQWTKPFARLLTKAGAELRQLCPRQKPDREYFEFLENSMMYGEPFDSVQQGARWG